eukprot:4393571-Amphidinium_carterae.1
MINNSRLLDSLPQQRIPKYTWVCRQATSMEPTKVEDDAAENGEAAPPEAENERWKEMPQR